MKIALLTDTHFGAKQDSRYFHDHIEKFYSNHFFPYCAENQIKHIIHLGDIFDRRKYINYVSLNRCKEYFFDALQNVLLDNYMTMDIIVGNHDTSHKNTNWPNSPQLLLQEYDNIDIIAHPCVKEYDGRKIILVPWINEENKKETFKFIESSDADTLFGHLHVSGFAMNKGYVSPGGLPHELFKNFELVCSGHFHHKSTDRNVSYLGTAYEITWADYDDPKGFHIYDTEKNTIEFIENPKTLFKKIYYDDEEVDYDLVRAEELDDFGNSYIKLIVKNKTDHKMFDRLVEGLYELEPYDLKIIEDFSEFSVRYQDVGENVEGENTYDMLKSYIDEMDTNDEDKKRVQDELQALYMEAIAIE